LADSHSVPGNFATIQGCIDAAEDGDECVVAPGRYNEVIDFIGKAITVRSTDPTDPAVVEATIIDGFGLNDSVVKCMSGEGDDTVFSGFTITGGTGSYCWRRPSPTCGGGMRNHLSSPSISHCVFRNNSVDYGGGMLNNGASPTISNCVFESNTASSRGGGLYGFGGSATIKDSVFADNVATYPGGEGGGMYNVIGRSIVTGTVFERNSAVDGGGMYNWDTFEMSIVRCVFSANSAKVRGGGLFNYFTGPEIVDCTFSRNSSREEGGGIYNYRTYRQEVSNCIFSGNSAVSGGGIFTKRGNSSTVSNCEFHGNIVARVGGGLVYHRSSRPAVNNCAFTGNSAEAGGGMVASKTGFPVVSNCTFASNSAVDGASLALFLSTAGSREVAIGNCVMFGDDEHIWLDDDSASTLTNSIVQGGVPDGVIDDGGNIDADPMFARVPDDGGDGWGDDPDTPNVDESANDDYGDLRVRAGSPVIDAGDNGAVPESVMTDLGGLARFVDDPFVVDTGIGSPPVVDMGAYEYQPDCNANGVSDDDDIVDGTSEDCNGNGYPDECDGDEDSDRVPDECDECVGSVMSRAIIIGRCGTEVPNASLGEGCMMADAVEACLEGSRPGRVVFCVTELALDWKRAGIIRRRGYLALVSCATKWDDWVVRRELGPGVDKGLSRAE
jgi:Chlamydia polymorphic membrane protein (Chlamydia_PMP) repeat